MIEQTEKREVATEAAASSPSPSQPRPDRWRILAAVLIGGVMGPIDSSVVNMAMPVISQYYQVSVTAVSWVAMSYLLVISTLLLTFGRLGDMVGYKRIYRFGLGLFTVASVLCGAAPSLGLLIAARVIQALGAGMFMAVSPAILTATFPPNERGRALGLNGMAVAAGLALGPMLGGALTNWLGWPSIFYINLPVGVAALIWTGRVLPTSDPHPGQRFDLLGATLAFVSLGSFLLFASEGEAWGWASPGALLVLTLSLLAGTVFLAVERRVAQPMLNLALFRNRTFSAANAAGLLNYMAQFVLVFLTPFMLQRGMGLDPAHAGLVMSISPLLVLATAPFSGALSDRIGTRSLAFLGMGLASLSFFLLAAANPSLGPRGIAWRLAIFGLGTGIFQSPNNSAVMGAAPRQHLGMASAVLASVRNVGMVMGVAVAGAVFSGREAVYLQELQGLYSFIQGSTVLGAGLNTGADIASGAGATVVTVANKAFQLALRDAYLTGGIISAIGALLCLVRDRRA